MFERFWLEKARQALGGNAGSDEIVLEKMRSRVAELSDLFTKERPAVFKDYMSDPALLAAYGLFFFPQSFARASFAARRLLDFYGRVPADLSRVRILDIGSGASPCGFALAAALQKKFEGVPVEVCCLDRSRAALEAARELAGTQKNLFFRSVPADLQNLPPLQFDASFDFIVLGWSLNEIVPATGKEPLERALVLLKKLSPALKADGTLLVLEPALKETAERLQRVADYFVRNPGLPYYRVAPELGQHPDPHLAAGDHEMWTHDVRTWEAPPTLEFLNRKLFRDISVLKFSWSAFGKSPAVLPAVPAGTLGYFRLVSPVELTKPALRFAVVDAAGTRLQIEWPTRGLSKSDCKKMAARFERGDVVTLAGELKALGRDFRLQGEMRAVPDDFGEK
ncbi:MAG: methyltransferase domain-containing protein [Opitutales bacterium]|nr:methyltransferase domain-containing protein [Opitutales bacterium]